MALYASCISFQLRTFLASIDSLRRGCGFAARSSGVNASQTTRSHNTSPSPHSSLHFLDLSHELYLIFGFFNPPSITNEQLLQRLTLICKLASLFHAPVTLIPHFIELIPFRHPTPPPRPPLLSTSLSHAYLCLILPLPTFL